MASTPEILIDAQRPRRGVDLRELWEYRDLLWLFVRRDIAVRYRQTALGALWAVLQPLVMMIIFTLIFGRFIGIPSDGIPYALFAFSGLLPWQFLAGSVGAAGNSVLASGHLISKVYFPRLLIPVSTLGRPLADLVISTTFMFVLAAAFGYWPSAGLVALPLLFVLTAVLALGTGALIAALTMSYRDVGHLVGPLITLWMFLTPVIYPPSLVPENWRWLLILNPMSGIVTAIRSAWFGLPWDLPALAASVVISLVALAVGVRYFRAVERKFVDLL